MSEDAISVSGFNERTLESQLSDARNLASITLETNGRLMAKEDECRRIMLESSLVSYDWDLLKMVKKMTDSALDGRAYRTQVQPHVDDLKAEIARIQRARYEEGPNWFFYLCALVGACVILVGIPGLIFYLTRT